MPVVTQSYKSFVTTAGHLRFKANEGSRTIQVNYSPPPTGFVKYITIFPTSNTEMLRANVRFNSETGNLIHPSEMKETNAKRPAVVAIVKSGEMAELRVTLPVGIHPSEKSKIKLYMQELTGEELDEDLKQEAIQKWLDAGRNFENCSCISIDISRTKGLSVGDRGSGVGEKTDEEQSEHEEQSEYEEDASGEDLFASYVRKFRDALRSLSCIEMFLLVLAIVGILILFGHHQCSKSPRESHGSVCRLFDYMDDHFA